MVLKPEVIEARLAELSRVVRELERHRDVSFEQVEQDLSQRWILERGLLAAASLILDVADHILAGHFSIYADTYEAALRGLRDQKVISPELYERLQGLGGLRNLLVHRYQELDPSLVWQHFHRALEVFPRFGGEVLRWLENLPAGSPEKSADRA